MLWAEIESLPRGLFDELFARYLTRNYLSLASHKELCRVHSLCKWRGNSIAFKKLIRELGSESVHNSFHYAARVLAKTIKDRELARFFRSRIIELEGQMAGHEIR